MARRSNPPKRGARKAAGLNLATHNAHSRQKFLKRVGASSVIAHCVLDVAMTEIGLQGAGIMPAESVGEAGALVVAACASKRS